MPRSAGRIDVLLNSAGLFLATPLTDTSLEEFRRLIDVNVVGVFLGMRTVAPAMIDRGRLDPTSPPWPGRRARRC